MTHTNGHQHCQLPGAVKSARSALTCKKQDEQQDTPLPKGQKVQDAPDLPGGWCPPERPPHCLSPIHHVHLNALIVTLSGARPTLHLKSCGFLQVHYINYNPVISHGFSRWPFSRNISFKRVHKTFLKRLSGFLNPAVSGARE